MGSTALCKDVLGEHSLYFLPIMYYLSANRGFLFEKKEKFTVDCVKALTLKCK
ncbi:hypothetical protein J8TS2_36320 [Lederbergia ruris]|uniref:Uncharacterized protein n=1 Tax=Lederbergia ruris TaxID=217495 RepID=A0ABQ4KN06_9BACI|nr:hypothetical protein J8TS2_36320 [Lederbergia ruris]